MDEKLLFQILADAILVLHVTVVLFVVVGLILIIVGNIRHWTWVNRWWFRLLHLGTILFVVAEAWLGVVCPLTQFEMWLRESAGSATYDGSFIEYWLQQLLYWDFPSWVFLMLYTGFALVVIITWVVFPPKRR
ncbi:DUF2784 domain-containing protein [Kangiella marina]|uniref:DUF2784 domain-containing protein n=1 Tax=Kangiella marina TaxID=1079178 RepID=A0ABP8IJA6_9GAMM